MAKSNQKHVPSTYAEVLAYADRTQQGINTEKESVAGYLLILAKASKDPDHFQAGCESAENDRRANISKRLTESKLSKAERKAQLVLPSCWSQPKSMILRGWIDFGMNPTEYLSYSAFSVKKREISKEKKAAQQANTGGGDNTATVKAEGAKDALKQMDGSVTAVLFAPLLGRIAKLPTEHQEAIAFSVESMLTRFETPAPQPEEAEIVDSDALSELEEAQIQAAGRGDDVGNEAVI